MPFGPVVRPRAPRARLAPRLAPWALSVALAACAGGAASPGAGGWGASRPLAGGRVSDEVRRALGGKPLAPCVGADFDLGAARAACACALPPRAGEAAERAGASCGEALGAHDVRGAIDVAVAAAPKLAGGEVTGVTLRFANRAPGRTPLVYRLGGPSAAGAPFVVRDARGERADTGGECGAGGEGAGGEGAGAPEVVVVLEAGGAATLRTTLRASREMYRYHRAAGGEAICERSHAEPLPPGPYEIEFLLDLPGLSAERPRLRFEVVAPSAR